MSSVLEPVIISASRRTDIPAFYGDWFLNNLKTGYFRWTNPFNHKQVRLISINKTRVIAFWTKNPEPLFVKLDEIDKYKINYYFLYTLNDYEREQIEPFLPPLRKRIESFIELSQKLGKERVIWRYDPLILSESISIDILLDKIAVIADEIKEYTNKLIISFVNISCYPSLKKAHRERIPSIMREWEQRECFEFAEKLMHLNKKWGFNIETCREEIDLNRFGIGHSQCINAGLFRKIFSYDRELMAYLGNTVQGSLSHFSPLPQLKDPGQPELCLCAISKDIGFYNSCRHGCLYCYAIRH